MRSGWGNPERNRGPRQEWGGSGALTMHLSVLILLPAAMGLYLEVSREKGAGLNIG